MVTREFSLELHHSLFPAVAVVFHQDQQQLELLAEAVVPIKMVGKQAPQGLLVEEELALLVVLVQLETLVVQQLYLYLAMVLICKAEHHVIKPTQKVAAVAAVVTTAAAAVPIKLQVADQKMAAVAAARVTLI